MLRPVPRSYRCNLVLRILETNYSFNFVRFAKSRETGKLPVLNQPQENFVEPPAGPQEDDDSEPLDDEKRERTFSGLRSPQEGHVKESPLSLTFRSLSKTSPHFLHRYS